MSRMLSFVLLDDSDMNVGEARQASGGKERHFANVALLDGWNSVQWIASRGPAYLARSHQRIARKFGIQRKPF
jgi:hypothetical protein